MVVVVVVVETHDNKFISVCFDYRRIEVSARYLFFVFLICFVASSTCCVVFDCVLMIFLLPQLVARFFFSSSSSPKHNNNNNNNNNFNMLLWTRMWIRMTKDELVCVSNEKFFSCSSWKTKTTKTKSCKKRDTQWVELRWDELSSRFCAC